MRHPPSDAAGILGTPARSIGLLLRGMALTLVLAGMVLAPAAQASQRTAAQSTIHFYGLADTNVADLWTGTLLPDFEKAYPQYTVKFVNLLHGNGAQVALIDRIVAAKAAGKVSGIDLFEDNPLNYVFPAGKTAHDYFAPVTAHDVANIKLIAPQVQAQAQTLGIAYRSSAVTLAYNTAYVSNPPKTFDGLIAWIKAHPGKFTYCNPQDGGTGSFFAARAVMNVMDERALLKPYNPAAEKNWPKAWALLRSIEPYLYKNGFHPNGNIPVLNLLGRGALWMATAWSDQGLQFRDQGLLPPTIHFTQITPPFGGGPTFIAVPADAQNKAGAFALLNFVLRPAEQGKIVKAIEGFPGIAFKYMPASVMEHFGTLTKGFDTHWTGSGRFSDDLKRLWAANVPARR
jgi:putative spermidine/putrescine transport system substrate-binding protein